MLRRESHVEAQARSDFTAPAAMRAEAGFAEGAHRRQFALGVGPQRQ
jgi:hypothetical protein